jgi:hypothetical protein
MSGNPEYQNVDPQSPPDQVTPASSPSSPANYAMVTPHGRGPAPYDIQAMSPEPEVTAAFNTANALGGAGFLYPTSERIQQAQTLLESPQGFGSDGFDVDGGWHGGGGGSWPSNVEPPEAAAETPIQGHGDYPGTTQEGIQKYGTS